MCAPLTPPSSLCGMQGDTSQSRLIPLLPCRGKQYKEAELVWAVYNQLSVGFSYQCLPPMIHCLTGRQQERTQDARGPEICAGVW